ncbi:hypothetical protein ACR8AL_06175 [Clavibacter sepedonicus]|uniref:hypothetical protein n=1 Tax=Clavibacter TaxID=1573 RepID=UPI00031E77C5|nr:MULTISPECIES: hypothetical protein [Clavibacter]UUK67060.1 hypothetical protein LRE50_07645 [Clavibacter sepedonicus]
MLDRPGKRLEHTLNPDDLTDAHAVAAIPRLTRGTCRLLERLFPQIARILEIPQLETITEDVIGAAACIVVTDDDTERHQDCAIERRRPHTCRNRLVRP